LKSALYDGLCGIFKKYRGNPDSASNNQIFKKKNVWALSKHGDAASTCTLFCIKFFLKYR